MIAKGWRRKVLALAAALAAGAFVVVATPSAASADSLRPLNVTLTCSADYGSGLPYGYQITTGSGLYYPPASSDATVVGNAKTFHLLMPTSAGALGVNTWCDGYRDTTWEGYTYGIVPGTSTVNVVGSCQTWTYSAGYGVTYLFTYCTLTSITYS